MKIRAIVSPDLHSASDMWRVRQPLRLLRQLYNWDVKVIPYLDLMSNVKDMKDAIVILHRTIPGEPKAYIERLLKAGAKAIHYSLDDYFLDEEVTRDYLLRSGNVISSYVEKVIGNIPRQIETINLCDTLIVTTNELRHLCEKHTSVNIDVLPNSIDLMYFEDTLALGLNGQNDDTISIGWAGGRRPDTDLEPMMQAWGILSKEYSNIRFVLAGYDAEITYKYVDFHRVSYEPWRAPETYGQAYQVDIGCCPLADNAFNWGKSPIKAQEYSIAKAAVVCSPTVYSNYIINGYAGLIAKGNTVENWTHQLRRLIEESLLRKQLVDTSEYQVRNFQSLQANIDRWKSHFEWVA